MPTEDDLGQSFDAPPVVVLDLPPPGTPDRLRSQHDALDRLIQDKRAFAIVTTASGGDETAEERAAQAAWLKVHLHEFAQVCRAYFIVEPDVSRRAVLRQQADKLSKAFPIPMYFAESKDHAVAQAYKFMTSR
ncbi:hypothetical protein OICFNHDK_3588 [Methylobacterium bullatum]|uniref:STAS/SEC14 domain-containing protein n=1 Tax=Methylobacterium bullatum TaxID=570505 RepID=A0A679KHU1_9HYPH|nr:hypothetical protein OICFNHDK_3588 [Methylobacterium bullatum]CAA2144428.1 hypothetical protein MBLL_03552 [Methylobacterium bullatum]